MNLEQKSDVESLKAERDRLEQEQDALFEQLKSDPANEDAKEQLIKTLEQINAIDGKDNKNISTILNKLNIIANFTLPPEDEENEEFADENYEDEKSEYSDIEAIRDVRREIIEKLPLLHKNRFEQYNKRKNDLDKFGEKLKDMNESQIKDLLQKYEDLLQDIEIDIRR